MVIIVFISVNSKMSLWKNIVKTIKEPITPQKYNSFAVSFCCAWLILEISTDMFSNDILFLYARFSTKEKKILRKTNYTFFLLKASLKYLT